MATNLSADIMPPRAMIPQTEARLADLEADTTHLRELDGPRAITYLDAMSEAMECGPYTGSEATALTDIQGMLLELDIEKAALRLGLFDDYIAEFGRAREACRVMGEACERDRAEVGRLRRELEEVREELRREREGAEGVDVAKGEERGDREQEVGKVKDVQEGLESLALGGGA